MRRQSGSISLVLGSALVLAAMALLGGSASAGHLDESYAADSEITLTERSGSETLTISISTSESKTTLVSDRSGTRKEADVGESVCSQLWTDLMALPIDELESATPKAAFPDSSEFTLTLRVGSTFHKLTVYDVDSLDDERHRNAIRAILALEREQMAQLSEG